MSHTIALRRPLLLLGAFALLLIGGGVARAQSTGLPSAYYPIPPDQPRGEVWVESSGVTRIQPQGGSSASPVLQLRLVIANGSDSVPWSIDTREVVAAIGNEGASRPAFVNTDAGTPPIVRVAQGQRATVDLYYPLPEDLATGAGVPAFEATWQLQTGAGLVTQRTPFSAETAWAPPGNPVYGQPYAQPYFAPPAVAFTIGAGPIWWYDPLYPRLAFRRYPGFVTGWARSPRFHVVGPRRVYGAPYRGRIYGAPRVYVPRGGAIYERGYRGSGRLRSTGPGYYRGPRGGFHDQNQRGWQR